MTDDSQPDNVIGATITATATVLVGGCDAAQQVLTEIDETIIVDWYIGSGERAEADDVVCKLVGPDRALRSGAQTALDSLHSASIGDGDNAYFLMQYRIY